MNSKGLLADDRKIGSHLDGGNSSGRFRQLQQTVVERGACVFVPQNFLHFEETRVVSTRPGPVAIRLIVESDRAVDCFFWPMAVAGGQNFV